jgi:hypothetical protein
MPTLSVMDAAAARLAHLSPLTVTSAGCLYLDGRGGFPVTADLVYRPRDCLAVNMLLRGPDGVEVGWTFAWHLLGQGLHALAGEGDITVRPLPAAGVLVGAPAVEVALRGSFAVRLVFPAADIDSFVRAIRSRAGDDARHIAPDLELELAVITGRG